MVKCNNLYFSFQAVFDPFNQSNPIIIRVTPATIRDCNLQHISGIFLEVNCLFIIPTSPALPERLAMAGRPGLPYTAEPFGCELRAARLSRAEGIDLPAALLLARRARGGGLNGI